MADAPGAGPSRNRAGPSEQTTVNQPIEDGYRDLAQNRDYLQMRVEVDGRIPFQHVYLWSTGEEEKTGTGRMKSSNDQYRPQEYGPDVIPCPEAPRGDELVGNPKNTKEYVETKGKGKAKQTDNVPLRRDTKAMRVFIPVSEKLNPQAKFFVGCRFNAGRLFPAQIAGEHIFSTASSSMTSTETEELESDF
ncbi:hypothetical protein NW765_005737 [Fusarium oxysporum]|nr:hypothetical protein NW765_005737 [Fusarium oxysporum]